MDTRFLEYYNRELRYLRELGGEFARDFPKVAGRLGLDAFECADPYVERLLEGFAFLAARVQLKIDAEFPRFTEHLLEVVCPNYVAPTPSMAVVQFVPDGEQASLGEGFAIPRGTSLTTVPQMRDAVPCEFLTAQDVMLWPIEVTSLSLVPRTGALDLGDIAPGRAAAVLRLRLCTTNGVPFSRLGLDNLTLFFRARDSVTFRLFELCVGGTLAIVSRNPVTNVSTRLDAAKLRPCGMEDGEALLPRSSRTFQGHALLHEYFAFPQRFLFAELSGLSAGVRGCDAAEIELLLLLDRHDSALEHALTPASLALFCAPAINLFPKRADRIQLSDRDHEYHVVADRSRPMDFEVHSVTAITGYGSRADAARLFLPFYRVDRRARESPDGAFFTVQRADRLTTARQRAEGPRTSYLGSETFVSLVDGREGPFSSSLRQLSVDTLCTNRDLPLLLPGAAGTDFVVKSGAPLKVARCEAGPSAPRPILARGELAWRLISQLSLNYLALNDQTGDAVRELLSLYADLSDPASRRQIQGIRSTSTRPIVRRLPASGPPTFGRGMEITLDCEDTAFEGTSAFLLGMVMAQFFARYVSLNSFTETVVRSSQRGEIKRWPMNLGRRPTL